MAARRLAMKVCLVGEAAVGKTALIQRLVLDEIDEAYVQTLGSKVYKHSLSVKHGGEAVDVELAIWDIMGQKGFRELLKDAYFYGAHGALAVCDVTRRGTLEDLRGWIGGLREITGPVPMALVANKWDLAGDAELHEADVARLAEAYDVPYHLTSAKTGDGVEATFRDLAERITAARLGAVKKA